MKFLSFTIFLFTFTVSAQNKGQWEQIKSGENAATVEKLYRSADEGFRRKEVETPGQDPAAPQVTPAPAPTPVAKDPAKEKENLEQTTYLRFLNAHGLSINTPTMPLEQLTIEVYTLYPQGKIKMLMTYVPFFREFFARIFRDKKATLMLINMTDDRQKAKDFLIALGVFVVLLFFFRAWRRDYPNILFKLKARLVNLVLFLLGSMVIFCVVYVDEASVLFNIFLRTIL